MCFLCANGVLILDVGFAANNISETYDAKIFSVATLLSSYLIYNSVKVSMAVISWRCERAYIYMLHISVRCTFCCVFSDYWPIRDWLLGTTSQKNSGTYIWTRRWLPPGHVEHCILHFLCFTFDGCSYLLYDRKWHARNGLMSSTMICWDFLL